MNDCIVQKKKEFCRKHAYVLLCKQQPLFSNKYIFYNFGLVWQFQVWILNVDIMYTVWIVIFVLLRFRGLIFLITPNKSVRQLHFIPRIQDDWTLPKDKKINISEWIWDISFLRLNLFIKVFVDMDLNQPELHQNQTNSENSLEEEDEPSIDFQFQTRV